MDNPNANPPHMTAEQFSQQASEITRWIVQYWDSLESREVTPVGKPGVVFEALPDAAPLEGAGGPGSDALWDRIREDLDNLIAPNLLHWQSPRFFGYFPCNASGPGVLGALVSSALNVNGMLWATSPAATELETKLLDWCAKMFGLPECFLSVTPSGGGCIQGTASESTLIAMLAGRERARDLGAGIDALRVYTSDQAHSSVVKGAMIAGMARGPEDRSQLRLIPTDDNGAMVPEALRDAMAADVEAGGVPCSVTATLGTTGTEGIDPLERIAEIVETRPLDQRPWLHADAAYTGAAMVCPEFQHLGSGLDRFDSVCLNPHKWLLTNFDCDLFWTRDHRAITRALSITPEYLRNDATDSGAVFDYRDWQIPLGRSFRALKLWFVLRHYGIEGLRAHIRGHVELAARLEEKLRGDPRFEIVGSRATALVCFCLAAGDGATQRLLREINGRGRIFLSHTRVRVGGEDRFVVRVAVGGVWTRAAHVDEAWAEICSTADRVIKDGESAAEHGEG